MTGDGGVLVSVWTFLLLLPLLCLAARNDQTCEVCIQVLKDVMENVVKPEDRSNQDKISEAIREHCGGLRNKEHKLCFYIGALPESATSIMSEVSKPLSWSMPVEKVCDKLRQMDAQICELKYDKQLDWKTVDLNKLRVKELKKILDDWGEYCKGCTEKSEFVRRINELKPKFVKAEL